MIPTPEALIPTVDATAPRLSVVVPCFNAASTLPALLDSLAPHLTPAIEVICVDDGSDDDTPALLQRYPWVRVERRARRGGAGACRNSGARRARGEWLLFLDADTRVRDPQLLENVLAFPERHPGFDAFSGCYHDHNPNPAPFARYLDGYERVLRTGGLDRETQGAFSGSLAGVRRCVFEALGGFDEDPRTVLEDDEFGCRLGARGYRHWFSSRLRVEHAQPGLRHYCRELVPRTRHYIHLLRRFGRFNEVMGGGQEGGARLLACLTLAGLGTSLLAPAWWPVALPPLLAYGICRRPLWQRIRADQGAAAVPRALGFDLITSLAIASGGVLGLYDLAARTLAGKRADLAVLWRYLRSLLSPGSPGYLILFLTHRCNATCGHCFDDAQRRRIGKAQELTLAEIERLADGIGPLGHLSLTGGEPFLRTDLPEIVAAFYRNGVRAFSISTNGSLPERIAADLPRILAAAPRARFILTLSYDGLGEHHDRLRGLPGLFAKAERSLDLLLRLRQWHPNLHLHGCMTLTDRNADSLPDTLALLARRGFDELELNQLRGTPADPTTAPVDATRYRQAMAAVKAANARAGSALGLTWLFKQLDRLMGDIVERSDRPWACGSCVAGRKLQVIRANGDVLPCEVLHAVQPAREAEFDGFRMGNLRDHDGRLRGVTASPAARRLTRMIRESRCHCSFECAITATLAYRPWRLPKLFWRQSRPY